ncbi:terminase large subunit [Rhizosphaericola mali]|uniref:Terminase n=1 Tax=Rhizosphaericola mali TaxID=2545455 RepID=A0A5P2G6K2_9BACT|nr:terminase large subunit [Rhizosphaericola mali]QES88853.1 hypothetical protein E0W69_009365 [Rhizosphaericola mali]
MVSASPMFLVTPVYHANYNSTANVVINQGGTDSGKTYAIMQLLLTKAITFDAPHEDPIITVVGESVPNLKKGAWRKAKEIIGNTPMLQSYIKGTINESDRIINFITGWTMEFISCTDEQSAKQGKRQYLFVNEANGINYPIFWQLAKRTRRQTFIDYNPSAPFWAHENLIGTDKFSNDLSASVQLIISDHRHNTFLSEEDHFRTENIKDPELWKVYARGKTGNLSGLIFPNWRKIPDDQFPWDAPFVGGLDFGYTNDPTAGVRVSRVGDSIFIHELFYETGLAPVKQAQLFRANGFDTNSIIYCEHDPDSIAALRKQRLKALPARKGKGSINAGIQFLKQFNVFYTASSENIHNEKTKYMWLTDPATGKSTNTAIDQFNHLMDASRYGAYTMWGLRA